METIIKEILYYVSFGSGIIMLLSLLIVGTIRCICMLIDHLTIANEMREAVIYYIRHKNNDKKIKDEDIRK